MQRKQQVGECWVCVILFACVCVGASDSTTGIGLVSTEYLKTLYILYSEW
jgi:hypothetical protein